MSHMNNAGAINLMKINDVVSFFHLQFSRWLIEDTKYNGISTEAKMAYMLIFNRFQLSKLNRWVNENGEVYVIYTRSELSVKLNSCEKKASSVIKEPKENNSIWEKRYGRGMANRIFLVQVEVSPESIINSKGGPFGEPDLRNENNSSLENEGDKSESQNYENVGGTVQNQDLTNIPFKNGRNDTFRNAECSFQDPTDIPTSIIDKNFNRIHLNQSQSLPCNTDELIDEDKLEESELQKIKALAQLECLDEEDAFIMEMAIERLYYSELIKIGNVVYPRYQIRQTLLRLDVMMVIDALGRLAKKSEAC